MYIFRNNTLGTVLISSYIMRYNEFMRIKKSIINLIYIWGSSILLLAMNFISRRIFLDNLSLDYLGYDSLFTSIFSFLTLSEMGIAGIISYHMYSEIATNNIEEIRKLLYMYKFIYKIVGIFVLCSGILVCPFIPLILTNSTVSDSWSFIYTIYFLQLLATLCTYFLAYRRILYVTYQKVYFTTTVDTIGSLISTSLKIIVLVCWKNYILYLLIAILNSIITNAVISYKSSKDFPEITKISISKQDFKNINLFHDVKNMIATKIAITIYGSSDSIITTAFLGSATVGMVGNYQMLSSKLQEFVLTIFRALQGSIGNLVYDNDKDKGVNFFYALDLIGFFFGYVAGIGLLGVTQIFIPVWLKNPDFRLPFSFLALLSLNVFIALTNNPMNYFRNTLGHFESDRNYMIAAALINVILTLILTPIFGITGVMVGTVVGHLLIYLGRTIVVFKHYVYAKPNKYILTFLLRTLIFVLTGVLITYIGTYLPEGLIGVLLRGIISVIISTAIFIIYSFKSPAFKTLLQYINTVINMILKKKK